MKTLKGKLIITYTIMPLIIIVSLSALFNLFSDKIFEQYALNQHQKQVKGIIKQIDQQYIAESESYRIEGIEVIANAALQNGIMIHVQTINKEIDWDIRQHKVQECQILLDHAESNMQSRYPKFQGGYAENTYDLKYKDKLTGYLTVGYYGPYSLGDNELQTINELNKTLLILGTLFLAVSVVISLIMAKKISDPVTSVISTSEKIAHGDYGTKVAEASDTREIRDLISSINEMSESLAIKEKQKKQITADVSHELRTPLFNLQGHMEAMIDQVLEPTSERLQNCHDEIRRLTRIVEQLQELSMIENNYLSLEKDHFDFCDLCKNLVADFEMAAKNKGVKIHKKISTPAPVYGDFYRLKQCFMNLIANSINYTEKDGIIYIEYEKSPSAATIRICDNGTGIPTEDQNHIFERFYRVDKSRSQMKGGMGIGLSITKAIVEAHGGTIYLKSKLGSGSEFTIHLPDKIYN